MKAFWSTAVLMTSMASLWAQEVLFQDDFKDKLRPGWSWIREDKQSWRMTHRGLEVRIGPGNMWGPENSARNLLVRPAPDPTHTEIEVAVTVDNNPTSQYEQ